LKITGELDVDLRSNIAAEARAKIVYERLINFCDDVGTKDALQFLMTREITHMKAFAAALDSMGKGRFSVGQIAPSTPLVNQYFNDSTGEGEHGEIDTTGPWNEGEDVEILESPALHAANGKSDGGRIESEASGESDAVAIRELLVDQMRDLLHAEKQLVKALPKMAKAANHQTLAALFETHLAETEGQVERLTEGLKLLDAPARAKACKGMMGLLEEGEEVIAENGKRKGDSGADLALIGAAQKVEHYEISAYSTARNLAQQLKMPELVHLLQASLAEEQNADQLLNQVSRPLMSSARMPAAIE
jgi:Mn-containing catalase